jgi:hypothetical protein
MAVPITTIQGSDNVALSRLTINANFSALKAASDAVTALLNPSTFTLSGVKSVQIDDSAAALSSSILSVSKGASILGNLTLGTLASPTSVLVNGTGGVTLAEASLNVTLGNVTISAAGSLLNLGGAININGEFRSPGISTAESNMIGLTSSTTYSINPTGYNKYVFLSNGSTASIAVPGLTASLGVGATGQVVELYHVKGPSGSVYIDTTNFVGLTGPITMTETGDKIKCIYEGGSWYLWDANPAFIYSAGATGATATASLSYTRV